jgi:hypothetical protein
MFSSEGCNTAILPLAIDKYVNQLSKSGGRFSPNKYHWNGFMQPWDYPVPHFLYKYLHPSRINVLTNGRVRFSQRSVFDDDHELQPDYDSYGTEKEITHFLNSQVRPDLRGMLPSGAVRFIANSTIWQKMLVTIAKSSMRSPDRFGIFCLTESLASEQMWTEYADHSRGFLICFDTNHFGFDQLRTPGRLGKVSYSDEPYGTFLGAMGTEGAGIFFRKRLKYAFEREWRSIRSLDQLEYQPPNIFLLPFDPASICGFFVRKQCSVLPELRQFVRDDIRYKHVEIRIQNE